VRDEDALDVLALQRLASLGQLSASLSHEVRNAMTGIVGFAQVARRRLEIPGEAAQVPRLLEVIEGECRRCLDMIASYLDYARAGGGNRQAVDLAGVVKRAVLLLRHQGDPQNLVVHLDLAADAPLVAGNASELLQVVLNLGTNALQAMPDGGDLKLSVGRDPEGRALLRVSDTGCGISAGAREHVFEAFFTSKPPSQGTGLGLYVVERIVRDHGGTIEVDSEEGRGASFTVHLPAWAERRAG